MYMTLSNKAGAALELQLNTFGFFTDALKYAYPINSAISIFILMNDGVDDDDDIKYVLLMHRYVPGQPIQPIGDAVWIKYPVTGVKMIGGKPKSKKPSSTKPKAPPKSKKPSSAKPKASPKSKKPSSAKPKGSTKSKASPKPKKPSSAKPKKSTKKQ
jgi:hypothetical protein